MAPGILTTKTSYEHGGSGRHSGLGWQESSLLPSSSSCTASKRQGRRLRNHSLQPVLGSKHLFSSIEELVPTSDCWREKADKIALLWPDAVGNQKLLHLDIHKTGPLEPLLQLRPWTDLIAGHFKCPVDFSVVLFKACALETVVVGEWIGVPVLELYPAARLD